MSGVEILVDSASLDVAEGQTVDLRATVVDSDGVTVEGARVEWASANTDIAEVTRDGRLTAKQAGRVELTASAFGTVWDFWAWVRSLPKSIAVAGGNEQEGTVGEALPTPLTVRVVDRRGEPSKGIPVTFSVTSGEGSVVAAKDVTDSSGRISAQWTLGTRGEQRVEASVHPEYAKVMSRSRVAFTATTQGPETEEPPVTPGKVIIAVPPDTVLEIGATVSLKAVARDGDGILIEDADIIWSSSNSEIATVDEMGTVLANAAGSVLIIAAATGCTADTAKLIVEPPPPVEERVVGDVIVNPDDIELAVGSAESIEAEVLDTAGEPMDEEVSWRTTASGVATVNSEGRVSGIAPGQARIIATSAEHSDTAIVAVVDTTSPSPPPTTPPPPTAPPGEFNEPAGFTPIVERAFNSKASSDGDRGPGGSEGWDGVEYRYRNLSVVNAPGDPLSAGSALRFTYPAGQDQNSGPGVAQTQGLDSYRQLYVRTSIRLGPTYYVGNVSNKLYFHRMDGSPRGEPFIALHDTNDPSRFRLAVNFQGTPDNGRGFIFASGEGAAIQRERWYTVETLLISSSSPGASDGVFRLWLNGQLVINVTDVDMRHSGTDGTWSTLHVSPTYGGDGRPNQREFYWDLGHAYVSGRN